MVHRSVRWPALAAAATRPEGTIRQKAEGRASMPKKEYRWAIYHIKGTPAKFLGTVLASDEEGAIRKAIAELEIKDLQTQKRLTALRQG